MKCPCCEVQSHHEFDVEGPRTRMWLCEACRFVWKDLVHFPPAAVEKARYDLHQNGSAGHREFLKPVVAEIEARVPSGGTGLDWGSGPVPVLAELLSKKGFTVQSWDPFYGGTFDPHDASTPFDFITLTEVIEHMHEPRRSLIPLCARLRKGGLLFIQTELWEDDERINPQSKFARWSYRRDVTHVGFFARRTFEQFGDLFGVELIFCEGRIAIFQK